MGIPISTLALTGRTASSETTAKVTLRTRRPKRASEILGVRGRLQLRMSTEMGLWASMMIRQAGPGVGSILWDGTDQAGRPVATGVYVAVMKADGFLLSRKILIVR